MESGLVSRLKASWVPERAAPRRIPVGLYRGLVLELNLRTQSQMYVGLAELETHRFVRRALRRCAWAIDVGAGCGELSVFALSRPTVHRVIAIEPCDTEVAALMRNLSHNGLARDERLTIVPKPAGADGSLEYVSLDSLSIDRRQRGFLKIDVDGAEMEVLSGASSLLQTAVVDVLVETHSWDLEQQAIAFLLARGFELTVVDNAWWRRCLPEQRPIPHNRWLWATKRLA